MISICQVRNGERCNACIFQDGACKRFRARHPDKKPKDLYYKLPYEEENEIGSEGHNEQDRK